MTSILTRIVSWKDEPDTVIDRAVSLLGKDGSVVVSPTKVGYIITATDAAGLERKFELKQRTKSKPAVVLCASLEQLDELAQTNARIAELYARCDEKDLLLGCILPWKPEAMARYIPPGAGSMVHDARDTSCFVIRYGEPSERIVQSVWTSHWTPVFASSANPSGQGNRGQLQGVGSRIADGADLIIEADDYVRSQQPGKDLETRYEQGVMISMVDEAGQLSESPPVVIRRGLALDRLMLELTFVYDQFDYRHGQYY